MHKFQKGILNVSADKVKALIIFNNAPAHLVPEKIKVTVAIQGVCFPTCVTLLLQSMDQALIVACKTLYQQKFLDQVLAVLEDENNLIKYS